MIYDLLSMLDTSYLAIEYLWFVPGVEIAHYSGHLLLFGCILIFDLRLLGLGSQISIKSLEKITVRYAILGFILASLSGLTLLLTSLEYFWGNPALINKFIFMALALINIVFFHFWIGPKTMHLDVGTATPKMAKLSGLISISLWVAVIACGRLIAYF